MTGPVIVARAPGKVVISGEYAVLCGAPALVAAVNRYVEVRIEPARSGGWVLHTTAGGGAVDTHIDRGMLTGPSPPGPDSPARLAWHVARAAAGARLPPHARVHLDSSALYSGSSKLGLGSSAAVCVALAGALGVLTGIEPGLEAVIASHRASQGGAGSGLDVAAARLGGLVRFQSAADRPDARRQPLPTDVRLAFFWTGHPASTPDLVGRFDRWRAGGRPDALQRLIDAAEAAADAGAGDDGAKFESRLAIFTRALLAVDEQADIGVFDGVHTALSDLANECEVVYKPCGAGGGDLGLAVAREAGRLDAFAGHARQLGARSVDLEIDQHGLTVSRS